MISKLISVDFMIFSKFSTSSFLSSCQKLVWSSDKVKFHNLEATTLSNRSLYLVLAALWNKKEKFQRWGAKHSHQKFNFSWFHHILSNIANRSYFTSRIHFFIIYIIKINLKTFYKMFIFFISHRFWPYVSKT